MDGALAVAGEPGCGRLDDTVRFEPETLLPVQTLARASFPDRLPESRLLLAMLEDAVNTLAKTAQSKEPKAVLLREEVLAWVRDIDGRLRRYPFTFREAVQYTMPDEDPDVLAATIIRRFTNWRGPRRVTLVRQPNNTVGTRRCGG